MKKLFNALSLVLMLSMILTAVVFADEVVTSDDDIVFNNPTLDFGNVCVGDTDYLSAYVAILRTQGGANQFKNGSTVTISIDSISGTGFDAEFIKVNDESTAKRVLNPRENQKSLI